MSALKKILMIVFAAIVVVACKKNEKLDTTPPVGLGGDTLSHTAIDQWLYDSLTIPYNIAVKYKWSPFELPLDKTLTPADESKVIDAMSAVKRVWIDPYNQETGSDAFMKKFAPKQLVLVGSVEYESNGTVIIGKAEGGNNISYFDINQNFDRSSRSSISRMIQTSHHEFGHILTQNVLYTPDYKTITTGLGLPGYTATWFNVSPAEAVSQGYITPYSRASYEEDFVEMIAEMLVLGRTKFNELVSTTNATAQQAFRTKEQIIVNYFREVYGIDFYSLQTRVQTAMNNLVPPETIEEAFGFGKSYSTASVDPANQTLLPQRASWMALFNESVDSVTAIPGLGLHLDSLAIITPSAGKAIIRMYITQAGNTFLADFNCDFTDDGGGLHGFNIISANSNAQVIQNAVAPLLNYFTGNLFSFSWYVQPSASIFPRIKFTPQATPNNYFYALLLP